MSRLLVLSFTNLGSDPRVDRQIAALTTRHEIVAAGRGAPRQTVDSFVELPIRRRMLLGSAVGIARLLTHQYERAYWSHPAHKMAFDRLRNVRVDAVVANDLETLPLALRLGRPVIFDAHEYAPGQLAELAWWRLLLAPYARWQCRTYIPRVASMMTVSESIAEAYERDTGVRALVVTNAPPRADLSPTGVHNPVRILHHGVGQRGRGLEQMVHLGKLLDDRFTLDFVLVEGSAGHRDELMRLAEGNPRVRFPEPWPMEQLVRRANAYDIGLFALPPVNLNRRFALPNKFFEFIQARLAVAIGPSLEMARLVNQYRCGIVADDFRPETLASALEALDGTAIASFKRASHAAANDLCAERNVTLLLNGVEEALAHRPSSFGKR